jgi:hypothetical protein
MGRRRIAGAAAAAVACAAVSALGTAPDDAAPLVDAAPPRCRPKRTCETTTTTAAPTSTTVVVTTEGPSTSTTTTTTTAAATTTTVPGDDPYADVPSEFDPAPWLATGEQIPEDMSWEPSGNFRTFCAPSHLAYDDPIVYPGQPGAAHLHMFFGNTEADAYSTYRSLRSAGDSTCQGGPLNRTSYWAPTLHNRNGKVIVPSYYTIYYKGGGGRANIQAVQELPNGLRMVAGYPGPFGGEWSCNGGAKGPTIPSCPAGGEVKVDLRFPMCWDGRLDAPDHRSHLIFATEWGWMSDQGCPASHPTHLPEISYVMAFTSDGDTGAWRLSSDGTNPPGSTFHADWFGAWDYGVQSTWTQECIREMRNCGWGALGDGTRLINEPSVWSGPALLDPPPGS